MIIFAKKMQTVFIILTIISLLLIVMAVVIMMGKGDEFIVGYNVASTKTQNKYNKRRLRIVIGILLLLISLLLPTVAILLIKGYPEVVMTALPAIVFVLIAGTFTATHFWVKK